ncbi:MAG: hypothetical protein KGI71_04705 [Patescibacteria group bacterium]|nr:hypothetical protein [Patescibacteria group bacterium]
MATLSATALTLADWASRMDPDEGIADIINLLSQTNEVLDDMLWVEGNLPTGHKTTVRTGLPTVAWRLLNYGVARSKSTTAQIIDACGMLEAYSMIDKDLVELAGDRAAFRMGEDMAFLESMSQSFSTTLMYGNTQANPERFLGFSSRFSTVNTGTANNAVNVIDGGGTGSINSSVWLVCWGQTTAHGIFPKNKKAGLFMEDVTTPAPVTDANGNPYQAYQTHYKWDCGLSVRDWRYVVRICNLDSTALAGGSPPNLINLMIQAMYKVPTLPRPATNIQSATRASGVPLSFGRAAIYCNRTVKTWLDIQATNKTNMLLTIDQFDGRATTNFRGVPIRTVDSLLNTEARVT